MWKTRLTSEFAKHCTVPIMGAPMADVSGGKLAAEVCRAGGLGFVGGGHLSDLKELDKEISNFYKYTNEESSVLAIGFIGHSSLKHGNPDKVEDILKRHQPKIVQFCAPAVTHLNTHGTNIDLAKKYGCHVMVQVGTIAEAQTALSAGADTIIAQGGEAGGHGMRPDVASGTLSLSARIVSLTREESTHEETRPLVLAAGGIVDGRGLAAALALGCDGVVLGTRLWASQEALGHLSFKSKLALPGMGPDQVIRTSVMDQIANTVSSNPWPKPYDSTGNLRNQTTDKWHGKEDDLGQALSSSDSTIAQEYRKGVADGDPEIGAVYSGKGVGDIHSIDPACDIVCRISQEAIAIVQSMPSLVVN